MDDKFAEPFTFEDLDHRVVERPLREMVPIEALRAWHWHSHEADRICATPPDGLASPEDVAKVKKAQRLWNLIEEAIGPAWPDGMSIGNAVHCFWPFRRPN